MAEDRLKILEERLTRIEAALTQRATATGTAGTGAGGFTPPGGVVSDPAPWAGTWQFTPRASIDPVPWFQFGRAPRWPWPTPVVDPGPFPTPVVDPAPWPNPIVDPAVFAQQAMLAQQANLAARFRGIGTVADPAPPDIGRLNVAQLEATIHSISAERARLDAMESMVKKQIDALKQQQNPG
jgi:hypothetical protein